MGGAQVIILLTLLATAKPCRIQETTADSLCEGQLSCTNDFNGAKLVIREMGCMPYYDDSEEYDGPYRQNFTISVKAEDFDFFSANDSATINELNDYITDIAITNGSLKNIPEAVSKLHRATIVDLSYNKIDSINFTAFLAPSKLNLLNMSHNNIAHLDALTDLANNWYIPITTIDLSHNNIKGVLQKCIPPSGTLRYLNLCFNYIDSLHNTALNNLTALLTLDISNNRIVELGSALSGLVRLEQLLLDHNNLTSINKDNFYGMSSLKYLNISSNRLKSIEVSCFDSLLALRQLDISYNQIKVLSKSTFRNNHYLYSLDVSFNEISKIESGAFAGAHIRDLKLHNNTLAGCLDTDAFNGLYFEKLDLSDGDITELGPALFGPSPTFQSMNFSKNIISKISSTTFRKLHLLLELDLSYNKLQYIEFDAADLTNLVFLDISNNCIKNILKSTFDSLSSLQSIDAASNAIEKIELMAFENLINLHILNLRNNPVTNIYPQTFSGPFECYSLDFSGTKVQKLPNNAFNGMESLNILNLSNSYLEVLEFDVFNGTGSIEFLDLSHNQIESFFINNRNIKLQKILLSSNNIKSISKTPFQNLRQVSLIDISNNKVFQIQPGSFRDCKMLKNLNLSNNILTFLKFGVFNGLVNLETLDVSNNKLFTFEAKMLYYLPNIQIVYLDNNVIHKLNYSEFSLANVRVLSVGGNLLSCEPLLRLIREDLAQLTVVTKIPNFDVENVNGITCINQAVLQNNSKTVDSGAPEANIYLEELINLNVHTNRYLAAIFAVMLCAILVLLGSIVYIKLRSTISNMRVLSPSREELPNAIELE